LNFIEGSDISLTIADDATDDEIDITTAVDNLPTTKITSGTFDADRIPVLPMDRYGSALPKAGGTHTGTLWMSNGALKDIMYVRSPSNNTLTLSYGLNCKLSIEHGTVQVWDDLISAYDNADKLGDSTHKWKEFHATDIHAYGTLDMAGHPLDKVPTPTSGSHAANKTWVDSHNWGAGDITEGTFNTVRIPILPTDRYGSAVLVSGTRAMTGDLDFAKHQAKGMVFERRSSAPTSPATAQTYYNTSTDKVMIYVA